MNKYPCVEVGLDYFESAPSLSGAEEIIRATPDEVFDALAGTDVWPVWIKPIARVEWTSSCPYSIGSTRAVYLARGEVIDEKFIAWDRGRRMAFCYTQTSENSMESAGEDFQITDLGDGRSKLKWTLAKTPRTPGRPASASATVNNPYQDMIRQFRDYVEGKHSA